MLRYTDRNLAGFWEDIVVVVMRRRVERMDELCDVVLKVLAGGMK
jgi:hypothetical protein